MNTTQEQSIVMTNNNGFAIIYATLVGLAISGAMYIITMSFSAGKKVGLNEQYVFHANVLADNLVEAGKHLILYENFFFLDDPFNFTPARWDTIKRLWGKGVGIVGTETEMARACGGFDAKGNPLGTGTVNVGSTPIPVFCPMLLRSNQINGLMLEKIIFEGIASKNLNNFTKENPGHYKISIPLFNAKNSIDKLSNPLNPIIDLKANQYLFKNIATRELIDAVNLNFEFFTDSSGFKSLGGIRQIKVSSDIIFTNKIANRHIKSESVFLLYPSILRDFTISIIYPKNKPITGPALLHQNLITANSPNKPQIRGRVLFNGDVDINNLNALPRFMETVVITGKLTNGQHLTDDQKEIFLQKFTKGLVTGMSMPRYLLSGECSTTGVKIVNTNGLFCKNGTQPFIMDNYQAAQDSCSGQSSSVITYNNEAYYCAPNNGPGANCSTDCGCGPTTNSNPKCGKILGGIFLGKNRITVTGEQSFISTVVSSIDLNATNIYGNIFAGQITLGSTVKSLIAMESVQVGKDPGIGSNETLTNYNTLIAQKSAGLLVNLPQMPTIILMDNSFK